MKNVNIRLLSGFIYLLGSVYSAMAQSGPYYPVRTDEPFVLDGRLDETAWKQAEVIDAFMQYDPIPGPEPTEKTECRMLYNDEYLLVGFKCYDSEIAKLVATSLDRDYLFTNDDGISFVIDTYRDKSTGIAFSSNLNGARRDRAISMDGEAANTNYNTFWDVKSMVNTDGYTMEFRIPFSSLRFNATDKVVMGFRLTRFIKRKSEYDIYPACDPNILSAYSKVSLGREMVFENLNSRTPVYVSPYLIANYAESQLLNADTSGYRKETAFLERKHYFKNATLDKIFSNIGLDIKYGITKNSTLDLTLNTDFAQAEVDNRIINLTKYDVNLPEKRTFFLESDDYFRFTMANDNELFISRSIGIENGQIVPIIGGARLTGVIGGLQIGLLEMQTTGVDEAGIVPHNYFVFRPLKRFDALGSSVGAILTNRVNTGADKTSYQSIGIDINKRFSQLFYLQSHLSSTLTDFKWGHSPLRSLNFDATIVRDPFKGIAFIASLVFSGADYNPVIGFADDNGYGELNARYSYRFQAPEKSKLYSYYIRSNNRYRMRVETGQRETFANSVWVDFFYKSQADFQFSLFDYTIDFLPFDWHLNEHNAIKSGDYKMLRHFFNWTSSLAKQYLWTLSGSYGDFYGGKRLYLAPNLTWRLNKHLATEITYEFNNIRFIKYLEEDRKTVFNSHLLRVGFSYLFSVKLSLKLFAQYDNLSRTIGSNFRFRYNPREGTDLYLVINRDSNTYRRSFDPHLPAFNGQAVTVKFVRTFGQ